MLVDVNNFVYKLFLEFGCDFNSDITNKFDAFRLGLTFVAALVCIYFVFKFLYIISKNLFSGRDWI